MDIREFDDRGNNPEPRPEIREKFSEKSNRFASSGKDATVNEISNIGTAFRAAAGKLHEQNDFLADWVDTAADKLDSVSNYLKDHEPEDILHDVQDFSKRNPYVTVGVMFAAGLALSRVLKSGQD
ncbi:MAG: hypothetical protein GX556_18965 [Fibrobacter sp.]|nr:hypothetical protein [Fibrobacter sp.]